MKNASVESADGAPIRWRRSADARAALNSFSSGNKTEFNFNENIQRIMQNIFQSLPNRFKSFKNLIKNRPTFFFFKITFQFDLIESHF